MKHNIVLSHPNEISRRWAQRIVSHHAAGAEVFKVNVESFDIGTTTRIKVNVEHNAHGKLPKRWFIKTPSLNFRSRLITALPRLLHKEVHFYKSLSHSVPVELPPILAAQSRFGQGSTLVMSDLAEIGCRPGSPMDALSVQQAEKVIKQLAHFHARHWSNHRLIETNRWLGGINHDIENHLGTVLAVPLMRRGLALAAGLAPAKLHAPALHYAANRRAAMKALAAGVQTLVHHDCHPGNLFWNGSEPGFLDWQLVRMGEGVSDIAYFLATSLKPENRRAHEKQLLSLYANLLKGAGIEVDENKLHRRYRAHLTYPFEAMVVTLAIGGMMDYPGNAELIKRAAAAVEENDSYAALSL